VPPGFNLTGATAIAAEVDHSLALLNEERLGLGVQHVWRAWQWKYIRQQYSLAGPESHRCNRHLAGSGHSLALLNDGTVWHGMELFWSARQRIEDSNVPIRVPNLTGITAIAGGGWIPLP